MVLQPSARSSSTACVALWTRSQLTTSFFKEFMKESIAVLREADVATPTILQLMKMTKEEVDLKNLAPSTRPRSGRMFI
jgi:signal recognition particle GTPase